MELAPPEEEEEERLEDEVLPPDDEEELDDELEDELEELEDDPEDELDEPDELLAPAVDDEPGAEEDVAVEQKSNVIPVGRDGAGDPCGRAMT